MIKIILKLVWDIWNNNEKIIIILLCLSSFSYAFWFSIKPKCNDKVVLQILKEILDKDEWIYVEYRLDEKSLKALYLSLNGIDLRELEALLSTDTLGGFKASFKSLFDLKEYANKFVYTQFSDFITEENESKKNHLLSSNPNNYLSPNAQRNVSKI